MAILSSSITTAGRILLARLLRGDEIDGITHCALGDGDGTFSDPANPPLPTVGQTALKRERCRKAAYKRSFLIEDPTGTVVVDGVTYKETATPTNVVGYFFKFLQAEGNGFTIKEYGFFGGTVAYIGAVTGDYAVNGVYNEATNPTGQVGDSGILFEVRNLPDFIKSSDAVIEIVGITRL